MSQQLNPYSGPAVETQPIPASTGPRMSPPSEAERRGTKEGLTWAQQLAKGSWNAFVLALVIAVVAAPASPVIGGGLAVLFVLLGFGVGVVALLIRRGQPNVLKPAIIGLTLNGMMILVWMANIASHLR